MKFIVNNSTSPYYNLALEEYVLKNINDDDYVLLWQNEPTVVIGRHQNFLAEINSKFIEDNKIHVIRRESGGGAVYHDLGNLNFSFITKNERELTDLKRFVVPVLYSLRKLGVQAEFSGRNDLTIEGRKFSGNAQYLYKDRFLHHGTILFNSDLNVVQHALKVSTDKIESKGIKSVRSRVANITEYLGNDISLNKFKGLLLNYIFEYAGEEAKEYVLTEDDLYYIEELMKEKYLTWEWNFGRTPEFNYRNAKRFAGGKIEVLLNVKNGMIEDCKIYGDFLSLVGINEIENKMKGIRYTKEDITRITLSVDIKEHFGGITSDEVLSVFLDV